MKLYFPLVITQEEKGYSGFFPQIDEEPVIAPVFSQLLSLLYKKAGKIAVKQRSAEFAKILIHLRETSEHSSHWLQADFFLPREHFLFLFLYTMVLLDIFTMIFHLFAKCLVPIVLHFYPQGLQAVSFDAWIFFHTTIFCFFFLCLWFIFYVLLYPKFIKSYALFLLETPLALKIHHFCLRLPKPLEPYEAIREFPELKSRNYKIQESEKEDE